MGGRIRVRAKKRACLKSKNGQGLGEVEKSQSEIIAGWTEDDFGRRGRFCGRSASGFGPSFREQRKLSNR